MFNFNEILFYSFTCLISIEINLQFRNNIAKYFLDFYPDLITFLGNNSIRAKKKIISKNKREKDSTDAEISRS